MGIVGGCIAGESRLVSEIHALVDRLALQKFGDVGLSRWSTCSVCALTGSRT